MKSTKTEKTVKCSLCGKVLTGKYEVVETKRETINYYCQNIACELKDKENNNMGKFNLDSLGVGASLLNAESKKLSQKRMKIEYIDFELIEPNAMNFYSTDTGIEELAENIKLVGELLQPLELKPMNEDGKYVLITGERRYKAIKRLRERGEWDTPLPAVVKNPLKMDLPLSEELKETLSILSTNQYRDKTDADLAKEVEAYTKIITELRKNGITEYTLGVNETGEEIKESLKGRKTREIVADKVGVSVAQVGKIEKVKNNGSKKVTEALENNEISIAQANEIVDLPEEKQDEVVEAVSEKGKTADTKKVKEKIKEVTADKGWLNPPTEAKEEIAVDVTEDSLKTDMAEIMQALAGGVTLPENEYMEILKCLNIVLNVVKRNKQ
ncbi:ParB-like chromosome segregation protein Spo0J [Lachnospiraceae bacterium PM6-15]|uniref:ParB/RepB/Spo0J family partition protein n=1 Tax=Ohessyouella blattaphilus TaxID=2949333 RepID=UPI003E2F3845